MAYSIPYQATATFFIFFATAIARIPPLWAGVIVAVSAVWDALVDPVVGYLSDNTEGRRGRRHPYLLWGTVGIAVFTVFLWRISPDMPPFPRVLLIAFLLLAVKTALAVFNIPYTALGGELSTDYDERMAIQGVRAAFYVAGMIVAIAGGTVVFFRATPGYPRGQLNPAAYPRMAIAFALLAAASGLIAFLSTRSLVPSLPARSEAMRRRALSLRNLTGDVRDALGNRDLRMIVFMIFILEAGFQFGIAIGIHVGTYTYGLTAPLIGLMALIVLGTTILSQPLWVAFTKRFEKRTALLVSGAFAVVGFLLPPWVLVWWKLIPLHTSEMLVALGIFNAFGGIANGAFMSIPNSMIVDVADAEELRTGKRDEGLFFGTYVLAYKLGTSVSLLLSGFALSWIGFDPGHASQPESTRFLLAMAPTWLLLFVLPFTFACIGRYGITRAKWQATRRALEGVE